MIAGALLDIDGTLLDSNDAHAQAWVEALAEEGIEVPFERVRPLIGMGGDKLLPQLGLPHAGSAAERMKARQGEIFRLTYLPELRPFPGARELVQRMKRENLVCVVATSSAPENVPGLLDAAGIADLVDGATSAGDVNASKPDPDIVIGAAARTGLPRSALLLLGDTPYDVAAGERAHIGVVALRCGGWKDEDLEGAIAIYDDPDALLASFEESPFARRP